MIAIADVCSGNLRSVERALTKVGADVVVTRDADVVRRADKVVVPGQGAFGVFMQALSDQRGMGDALREAIVRGTPYLGICLGMQVLFESSEETGHLDPGEDRTGAGHLAGHLNPGGGRNTAEIARTSADANVQAGHAGHSGQVAGLGVLRGAVRRLNPEDRTLKVPHIGWNRVRQLASDPVLAAVEDEAYFYFVHSFHAVPTDGHVVVAQADHGGPITAAVRKDNLFACQFHPEKSQAVGLSLLSAFVRA